MNTRIEETYKVEYSDCSSNCSMTTVRITEIIQNMLSELTENIGVDNITLKNNYNVMWVFVKHKVSVNRAPIWNEKIKLVSQVLKTETATSYFETTFVDLQGNIIVNSVLEACLLDTSNFKIQKLSLINFPVVRNNDNLRFFVEHIDGAEEKAVFYVTPSMIDYSKHLNNTKALTNILDSFSLEYYEKLMSSSYDITIKYCSQARIGQQLHVCMAQKDELSYFEITDSNSKTIIKTSILINN